MVARLGESFGLDTITKAATRMGMDTTAAVGAGLAGVTSSGLVTTGPSTTASPRTDLRPHRFHGGSAPQR